MAQKRIRGDFNSLHPSDPIFYGPDIASKGLLHFFQHEGVSEVSVVVTKVLGVVYA
jgi:hypothetical protein